MTRPFLRALATSLVLACGAAGAQPAAQPLKVLPNQAAQPLKVLRYAFPIAETGFDPAQISDLYSRTIAAAVFGLARTGRARNSYSYSESNMLSASALE